MKIVAVILVLLITGCTHSDTTISLRDTLPTRSAEYDREIRALLAIDTENKKWERLYLQEIAAAQDNDDIPAYKFFIVEFIKIPRIRVPIWMRSEPGYTPSINAGGVLQGSFLKRAGLKITITPIDSR